MKSRTDHALALVRVAIKTYAEQLVERIQQGTREAFSASITQMLLWSLWIVVLGLLIVLFIPELPLRSRGSATKPAEA